MTWTAYSSAHSGLKALAGEIWKRSGTPASAIASIFSVEKSPQGWRKAASFSAALSCSCSSDRRWRAASAASARSPSTYPQYFIAKNKIQLSDPALIDRILNELKKVYASENINDIDGVKIIFEAKKQWVHLRKSNTEPIIRIYAEAGTMEAAEALGNEVIAVANKIIG